MFLWHTLSASHAQCFQIFRQNHYQTMVSLSTSNDSLFASLIQPYLSILLYQSMYFHTCNYIYCRVIFSSTSRWYMHDLCNIILSL